MNVTYLPRSCMLLRQFQHLQERQQNFQARAELCWALLGRAREAHRYKWSEYQEVAHDYIGLLHRGCTSFLDSSSCVTNRHQPE